MPDIDIIHIVLLVVSAIIGAAAGWFSRGNRAEQEKAAVSSGWQEQIGAQRKEHERLLEQNKSLMEQVSQYQASNTDAKNRAKELSSALQEAFERRDELQREIKNIRSNLEVTLSQRDQLQTDMAARGADEELLRQKDQRIEKLSQELANWQERLPPLIERFRVRNEEAQRFEAELEEARQRIAELESDQAEAGANQTRIEPVHNPDELTDGLDASNDPEDADIDASTATEDENEQDAESLDERDNLQQIKGVGPAIEKTLNELGIFSLRQIADMSEYDIDRVARKLKGFHSRIYREDWIGQARELLSQAARA
jgi:predicted flap endonuclease-1-like 5' DNA nuclease